MNRKTQIFFISLIIAILGVSSLLVTSPNTKSALDSLALSLYQNGQEFNQSNTDGTIERGTVARVKDGDTIVLTDGRDIRYLNVDTPESVHPTKPVQCYGKIASNYNKELVEGKEVILKADKEKTDKYGRDLRFVWLATADSNDIDTSVNAQLVRLGYARESTYKPNNTYQQNFKTLETQAKAKNIGLWAACKNPFVE